MGTGPSLVPMVFISYLGPVATDSIPPRRWTPALILAGAVLLGAAGFLAGRLSALRVSGGSDSKMMDALANLNAPVARTSAAPVAVVQTNRPVNGPSEWDESQWQRLYSQPGSVARNAALAAMLEKLAAEDPQRSMAMAQGVNNLKLRDALVQASLHGWALLSPTNAANWALALSNPTAREAALTSVFAGALAADPDGAVRLCNLVCQQDPGNAAGYGSRLIDAMCEAGNFDAAAKLAAQGDGATQRSIWMAEAWSKWAELQPDQAAAAAVAITDPDARNEALHGVVGGWAAADPAGLANFLSQQPAGGDRGLMLGQALQSWVGEDPVAAANWINGHTADFGPDLDKGVEAVATLNTIHPDLAVNWAESIDDDQLRSAALADILRNWVQTDLSAAQKYFETTQDLQPADRQQIAEIIAGMNSQAAAQ